VQKHNHIATYTDHFLSLVLTRDPVLTVWHWGRRSTWIWNYSF